ncbi:MAG: phosphoglycerate dehydrogenase [Chloroflexi bacterium]|nr:phosphoglycerate dehydrogenase [Chloroflexota bacterium]
MATVLVTRRYANLSPDGPLAPLYAAGHEVRYVPANPQTPAAELIRALDGCDAVVAIIEPYTAEVFDGAPTLRHVSRIGIGYDAVDIPAATERGVVVSNTPGANANAVADFTMGLLLGVARWIPLFDREVKGGIWQTRIGGDVWQKTLGIVGLGNIGRGVARRARGFDMKILAYEPYPQQDFAREHGIELAPLERVFAESDFVTLHLPSSAETENTVNDRTLGLMKPTAYLVNAARGPLVDEQALYRALSEQRIAGAALDVRVVEPNHDSLFRNLDNVVLAPHAAGSTETAAMASMHAAAENVVRVLRGERPDGLINPTVWDRRRQ